MHRVPSFMGLASMREAAESRYEEFHRAQFVMGPSASLSLWPLSCLPLAPVLMGNASDNIKDI